MTQELFRDDSYLQSAQAIVTDLSLNDQGQQAIALDQTIFYIHGGGQPGDAGTVSWPEGVARIITTKRDHETGIVWHILDADQTAPTVGTPVALQLDWEKRYARMKMHTALHLLCAIIPLGVTGGQIGDTKSRLDFDTNTDTSFVIDKDDIAAKLNALITDDHPLSTRWVDDALLQQQPDIVRTMSVKPPANADGLLRLVQIGDDGQVIDLQPCGGTHVARTAEIGSIRVGKIENKGARNKRVNLLLG